MRRAEGRHRIACAPNVNRKWLTALVFGLLCCGSAEAADRIKLTQGARQIDLHPETGVLAAGMMLKGAAFLTVTKDGLGSPDIHPDWPTLDALALPGGRFLLADRFGLLRLVTVDTGTEPCRATELASWPVEGTPTGLWATGNHLLVASAGAGLLTFEWDGSTTPTLASRYPFVDYSKEIRMRPDGLGVLADNWDTGLQVLDLSNPVRPVHLATVTRGFVDSVALAGDTVAIADRRAGARVLSIRDPKAPVLLMEIPPLPSPDPKGPDVKRVVFSPGSRLMVCEGPAGAQLVRFGVRDGRPSSTTVWRFQSGGVNDAAFLSDTDVLLSLSNGEIRRVQLPQ